MARSYLKVHRGTNEWSRKIRKATETRRVRRAVKETLRNAALADVTNEGVHLVVSTGGADHL